MYEAQHILLFLIGLALPYLLLINGQSLISSETDGYHIPIYHSTMLNDQTRNDAFFHALKASITNESIVLDLGAGSGLLSLMAASLSSKKVIAIERRTFCSSTTREVFLINNSTSCNSAGIELICKDALHVLPEEVLKFGPPSILVSETLDSYLIGEGFLTMLHDYKHRGLIGRETQIIPHSGTLYIQLTSTKYSLPPNSSLHTPLYSFDFSPLVPHRMANEVIVGRVDSSIHTNLSEIFPAIFINFQDEGWGVEEEEEESLPHTSTPSTPPYPDFFHYSYLSIPVTESGQLDALVIYFHVDLLPPTPDTSPATFLPLHSLPPSTPTSFHTFPTSQTHWKQMTYILPWVKQVEGGRGGAEGGSIVNLQIAQLPERIVVADFDTQRLVRINNLCPTYTEGIDFYMSRPPSTSTSTSTPTCAMLEEEYIFTFNGGMGEYNVWISYPNAIFMGQFLGGKGRSRGGRGGQGYGMVSFVVTDTGRGRDGVERVPDLFTYEIHCPKGYVR